MVAQQAVGRVLSEFYEVRDGALKVLVRFLLCLEKME